MSYLAQGLQNGFGAGFSASQNAKDRKQRQEENLARQQLLEDKILQDAKDHQENRRASRQNEIERNNRFLAGQQADADKQAAFANDPREQLARAKAALSLEKLAAGPTEEEQLQERVARMRLEQEAAALGTPAAPRAKVRQPIGPKGAGGYAEYEMPVGEVPSLAAASAAPAYKSPFGRRIADLDKIIAAESAAIEGGDRRKGILNMTSREGILQNAQSEKLKLLALELEDKVRAGVISPEEADAEADRLLTGTR